ncbi:MAG: MGH1-like glycoside hydrolase domain-containing protein [Candidatus Sumerlaeia bacterium]
MSPENDKDKEWQRLRQSHERTANWQRWGPYLADRQWGTVREDYSDEGEPWEYFPHDHARSRVYRWGEDGLLGLTDRECRLCFALALWNEKDPILKERLFGLTGKEGNHGEDVKENYYYIDATPSYSYMKGLYKYPQQEYPYEWLIQENARRGYKQPEFEIEDTGIFDSGDYFDVMAEYAKNAPNDILIRLTISNRGSEAAPIHILPTLWFRNTWSSGCTHEGCTVRPSIWKSGSASVSLRHITLGQFHMECGNDPEDKSPKLLFTENETNRRKLFQADNLSDHVKDAFHEYVIHDFRRAVNPRQEGTKCAAYYKFDIPAGKSVTLKLRLFSKDDDPGLVRSPKFDNIFEERVKEADAFYEDVLPTNLEPQEKDLSRQALAGLLWTKQFYHYVIKDWLEGDPKEPPPPQSRKSGRNSDWPQLFNRDVISMPDKWEYPWYASWDLAFHMIPLCRVDPYFTKDQLVLFLREWYMRLDGQLPAYEWNFSDVNPPVHAWACWRVYKMTAKKDNRDIDFLSRVFQKLMLNFTWWVNRKDVHGRHIFTGGFLGMDNVGVFDRSRPLPEGGHLEQADATAWMACFCATMLSMSLEIASHHSATEDVASKFFEHFIAITDAMNSLGGNGLWDEEDGFYYDQIITNGEPTPMRLRSMVGLVPILAVEVLEDKVIDQLPGFKKRMNWFLNNRPDLASGIAYMERNRPDGSNHALRLLAIPSKERLQRVLFYMLDENEFLSPYGIRSLSKAHQEMPFIFHAADQEFRVRYCPGESEDGMFGGNSNWRGPVWFPLNYLIIEALERYHHFYQDSFQVECPTGSGNMMNLKQVSQEIASRLSKLFLPGEDGQRACFGNNTKYKNDEHYKNLLLFHEYFHGETGKGLGANHQTGWTSLVANCLEKIARER